MKNNVVLTLTGPSCSGKTTIEAELTRRGMQRAVSTTTRTPRAGEEEAGAYHFVSRRDFEMAIVRGDLVEHVTFGGSYYGLTKAEFERGFSEGKPVVAVVEPQGRNQISRFCQEHDWKHVSAFIDSNPDMMLRRLASRAALDLQEINLDDDVLAKPTKVYATLENRLRAIRDTEFAWMKEARTRAYKYTAYIRLSNEQNFSMIIGFLEGMVGAAQEPGTMFWHPEPYRLADAIIFEPWMKGQAA